VSRSGGRRSRFLLRMAFGEVASLPEPSGYHVPFTAASSAVWRLEIHWLKCFSTILGLFPKIAATSDRGTACERRAIAK